MIVLFSLAGRKRKLTFFERLQSTTHNGRERLVLPKAGAPDKNKPATMESIIAKNKASEGGDPVSEAIAKLEERVDMIATSLMGTEEFARTANLASNVQMRMQKGMSTHMARQLAMFNMPSRDDITSLGERMMSVDERLVRIEEMLQRMAPAPAASERAAQPPRTRKPKAKAAKKTAKRAAPKKAE